MRVRSLAWKDPQGVVIGNPLQYSCLENSKGSRVWRAESMGLKIDTAEHTHTVYRSFQVKNLLL